MNILIVEDNNLIRDGLVYYLSNEGFEVFAYASISEASEDLVDKDLAILDISLEMEVALIYVRKLKNNKISR